MQIRIVPLLVLGLGTLTLGGCAQPLPPEPVISALDYRPDPKDPNCWNYNAQAIVEGRPQPIVGHACRQPDGTWRITEGTQEKPDQYVFVYGPPPYSWYPDYCPWGCDWWWWGPPIGLSLGTFVVVGRDHHHYYQYHFNGFAFHGPHGSFVHGFGPHFGRDHGTAFAHSASPGMGFRSGGFAHGGAGGFHGR
ncbi:MAG: hypothetical protein JOY71_29235 [Acetobacteraceae bacterium]|nr:hypothetical protein [Acetobacteraceae bacterium]MBV8526147.1 hypothetical protein [Acetobacteraceae bacterium]MBV8590050.1 hypothetical protein [Acetobacteraceae bacterium]